MISFIIDLCRLHLHIDGPPSLDVHIPAKQQNEASNGQSQNADAAPEINDEEMLTHACQYVDDHLAHPHTEHAHQIGREGVETTRKFV